ncbi:YicC/YloC family endoribonuclease [Salibacterium aidingense]|uniref:YicC/YloC family endoribonuclease n=1 Tax=Salibacterium aidingense TaxID=384933 RepID=UPI00047DC668|nr:YicC/YloC family endoribonuclease [Salibacterium aidingense]
MSVSMTGYGSGAAEHGNGRVFVEMKSVNHRFCDIQFRMPRALYYLEDTIRRIIQQKIERGRIEVFITLEGEARSAKDASIDWNLLHRLLDQADEMEQLNVFDSRLRLQDFLLHPDIVAVEEQSGMDENWEEHVKKAVEDAADQLSDMRKKEGGTLRSDLLARIETVQSRTKEISEQAPLVVDTYRKRLQERMKEFLKEAAYDGDDQRLMTEVAVFSEKANIEEELTRLFSHCDQFSTVLYEQGAKGRKLDFLVQEMNREANTIGSKANSASLSHLVVEIKSELEKMKEQVQNIE